MNEINEATLYWNSDNDALGTGWVLRYLDAEGVEYVEEIGETQDAGIETLAHQAADCVIDGATGTIRVEGVRGDTIGMICLNDGVITNWMSR